MVKETRGEHSGSREKKGVKVKEACVKKKKQKYVSNTQADQNQPDNVGL